MLNKLSTSGSPTWIRRSVSWHLVRKCVQTDSRAPLDYATEEFVGAAIKESGLSRSELYITTKFSGLTTPSVAIDQSLTKVHNAPQSI